MISLEECREYLQDESLSDEEVSELRAFLYSSIEGIMDKELNIYEQEHQTKSVNLLQSFFRKTTK